MRIEILIENEERSDIYRFIKESSENSITQMQMKVLRNVSVKNHLFNGTV